MVLACSFALYGLVKKVIPLPPTSSLTAEGLVLVLPALAYLAVLGLQGSSTFVGFGAGHTLLLLASRGGDLRARCSPSRPPRGRCRCRCSACCST